MGEHFNEEAIRPEVVRQKYWKLLEEEVARLRGPDGLVLPKLVEEIPCPLCGSTKHDRLYAKRGFWIVACAECSLVFVNPAPRPEVLASFYNSEALNFLAKNILNSTRERRKLYIHRPRAELIKAVRPQGRLLEIGCSVGYFLEAAKEVGSWELHGVEPNTEAAAYVERELGVKVYATPVERLALEDGRFDVIACFEVIEHLRSPRGMLKACRNLLSSGGTLVISTPNVEGYDFLMLGERHRSVSPPGHLVYFSPDTFARILDTSGFEVLELTTPGRLDVDNVVNEISRDPELKKRLDPISRKLLLDASDEGIRIRAKFQDFLAANRMSGHMMAVCRRRETT